MVPLCCLVNSLSKFMDCHNPQTNYCAVQPHIYNNQPPVIYQLYPNYLQFLMLQTPVNDC